VSVDSFQEQLARELPTDIPIYNVAQIDLKSPSASQIMDSAEYLLTIATVGQVTPTQWQDWVETIIAKQEIWWEHTTKSGKSQLINLRDRLFELELVEANTSEAESTSVLRYSGSCRHDGQILRPEQIVFMLETVSNAEFHLLHIHRNQLVLVLWLLPTINEIFYFFYASEIIFYSLF